MGHAPRGPVRPLGLVLEEQLPAVHVPALELLDVAEPVQVALQAAGGDPVEGHEESLESRMERVDHVDVSGRRVLRIHDDVLPGRCGEAVGGMSVAHHRGSFRYPRGKVQGENARARRASIDGIAEAIPVLVDAAFHDDPLFAAASRSSAAILPVAVTPTHGFEPRVLEVSRQVVPDQSAIDMERARARGQEEGAHDLADAHAHEPRGVERHATAISALAQGQRIGHALRERHPRTGVELRVREQGAALRRERTCAALACPPLRAVGAASLLDETRASTPRTAFRLL